MRFIYYLLIATIFILVGWFANVAYHLPKSSANPISQVKPRPLEKYTLENLSKTNFEPSQLTIEGENLFSFKIDDKKVTGCINIPEGEGPFPLVVMFRGYVDQKTYNTCDGSKRAGEYFSDNGFITVAPDFLGYAGSDSEAANIFESRFQTHTTALTLLKSVHSLDKWDKKNLFIWGHSNGGQIALTVLETSKADYPTVLWAPVSKPFPYSILYYTDESDDRGKLIRTELAKFEEDYDVEMFSLTNYLDAIAAPIELHQGTVDDAIPVEWSDLLAKKLPDVKYYKYPGADHNLNPSWNLAVARSLTFFQNHIK
jgi:dipeptidyl aminopeptidase/acylaminoacyl peptidase